MIRTTKSNSLVFLAGSHLPQDDDNSKATFDPLNLQLPSTQQVSSASSLAATLFIALAPSTVWAVEPDWGLFEGRTASLLHPVAMGALLLMSVTTGIKGLKYRRQRTVGEDIVELKKTLPNLRGAASVRDALLAAEKEETVDGQYVKSLKEAMSIQDQIDALVQERKDLASQNLRDDHFSSGAVLAFLGTAFAIEGPLNTYARAGKLFPGPHLYAGAALVVLWAAAAACVPAMQKGNDAARSLHIAANVAGMGLFAWQVVSGLPILFKVIEKTSWP